MTKAVPPVLAASLARKKRAVSPAQEIDGWPTNNTVGEAKPRIVGGGEAERVQFQFTVGAVGVDDSGRYPDDVRVPGGARSWAPVGATG